MIHQTFGDKTASSIITYSWWKVIYIVLRVMSWRFKVGQESLDDDERTGRLLTAVHDENVTVCSQKLSCKRVQLPGSRYSCRIHRKLTVSYNKFLQKCFELNTKFYCAFLFHVASSYKVVFGLETFKTYCVSQ